MPRSGSPALEVRKGEIGEPAHPRDVPEEQFHTSADRLRAVQQGEGGWVCPEDTVEESRVPGLVGGHGASP
ncbi:hypothetical protein MTP02_06180 [Streptomyces albus]|nr:hypothetical protein MTP02_06180 [Streptomyces albus]